MKPRMLKRLAPALMAGLVLLTACSMLPPRPPRATVAPPERLSDAEQVAGEIMAYLMEVVLGRAGALEKREAWSTRGRDLPLDFDMVAGRMFGPVPLRAELMVLDTNILGLSEVLYHYDRRMNLFKGTREHNSLYPCAELMAIRLFVLHKLHRNGKVSIAAMVRHSALFAPGTRDAAGAELAAMGLTGTEFRFLKAIFQSEPAFLRYMRHPFIVSMFRKIGVAESDAFTLSADLAATYSQLSFQAGSEKKNRPVTIAIVPSMNAMFEVDPATGRVRPSDDYLKLQEQVKTAIVRKVNPDEKPLPRSDRLAFFAPGRPVAIHPQNADRVIGQLCPDADFTVILLGKNVYRAMFIDPGSDVTPYKNRIYLDMDDVRYQQIDDEIDAVVTAIMPAVAALAGTGPGTPDTLSLLKENPKPSIQKAANHNKRE